MIIMVNSGDDMQVSDIVIKDIIYMMIIMAGCGGMLLCHCDPSIVMMGDNRWHDDMMYGTHGIATVYIQQYVNMVMI